MTINAVLKKAREAGESAFIPFVMAGDPSLAETPGILRALQDAGADAAELGVPFSDPVADGETVQRAAERALASGATLRGVLEAMKRARDEGVTIPVCLFSYLNPVLRMGYAEFARAAKEAGAQGALIVDLPPEEAGDYCAAMAAAGMETVFLCSPTTTEERLKLVDSHSTGFVYYVAREGVTGARAALPQQLEGRLAALGRMVSNPVAVGFGISTREHVQSLEGKAAGIVVGSALVKVVAENGNAAAEAVGRAAKALKT